MQFLADLLECHIERPKITETTALGAALLAGLGAGHYTDLDSMSKHWCLEQRFTPTISPGKLDSGYEGWLNAIKSVRTQ